MLLYSIKRFLWMIPTLLGAMFLVFSLTYMLPGNPAEAMLGPMASQANIDALTIKLGLDQPIHLRYWNFLVSALQGDLGVSVASGHEVSGLIAAALPHTAILAIATIACAAVFGIGLGALAAINKGGIIDKVCNYGALLNLAVPSFVVALLLLMVFSVWLAIFPVMGAGEGFWGGAHHLVLPVLAMATGWAAFMLRIQRETMIEALRSDYIRTARSFGAPRPYIVYKYALKNSIIPSITILGMGLGSLFGGAVFIEIIFNRRGLGQLIVHSIYMRDLPIVQGGVLVATVLFVLTNIIADLIVAWVDPRIRLK